MRVSTLRTPDSADPAPDRVPLRRAVWWTVLALLLLAGVALSFLYGRGMTPLL